MASQRFVLLIASLLLVGAAAQLPTAPPNGKTFADKDFFQLALNLEYLEAEFYLKAAYGFGVDKVNETLTGGGPPSIGGRVASLSAEVHAIAEELALQEVGHIRIIREFLGTEVIPRPLIDVDGAWHAVFKGATADEITHFDPYAGDLNFLLAAYTLPYVGLTAYVGTNPNLVSTSAKKLLAGVLGVEGGQDALLRTALWLKKAEKVSPYEKSVVELTGGISALRNKLDMDGRNDDENIEVYPTLGAEGLISTNILSANADSLSFARNAYETIRIIYGTGNASKPGGFFPKGVNGNIGKFYLSHPVSDP